VTNDHKSEIDKVFRVSQQ